MKYSARKITVDGKETWAVCNGKRRYFPDTITDSEIEAKKFACEMSAHWYLQQMNACEYEWAKLRSQLGEPNSDKDWSDVLA